MTVREIQKGDIITYCNGGINYVNKPEKYHYWFDELLYNRTFNLGIAKIQRYVKFLWFYRLKTIYKRKGE